MSEQIIKIPLLLSQGTLKKSEKLQIMEDPEDKNEWLVQGSSQEYAVTFNPEDNSFVCYTQNGDKQLCQGWKFCKGTGSEKQCKHILAVITKSENFELSGHAVTEPEPKKEDKEELKKKAEKIPERILQKNQKF